MVHARPPLRARRLDTLPQHPQLIAPTGPVFDLIDTIAERLAALDESEIDDALRQMGIDPAQAAVEGEEMLRQIENSRFPR